MTENRTKDSHIILLLILSRLLLVLAMNPSSDSDPMTEAMALDNVEDDDELFEGDIILTREQKIRMGLERSHDTTGRQLLSAIRNKALKWQNTNIPVTFDESFTPAMLYTIHSAMISFFHAYTCIKFEHWTNQTDYINIVKGNDGFSSYVGRVGGKQTLTLSEPLNMGIVAHALMHALGFLHEHNRLDRDKYVTVFENNIKEKKLNYYKKRVMNEIDDLGFEYDQLSITHYRGIEFAIDTSKPTMTAKNGGKLGQVDHLTETDVAKINKLYNCPKRHDELK